MNISLQYNVKILSSWILVCKHLRFSHVCILDPTKVGVVTAGVEVGRPHLVSILYNVVFIGINYFLELNKHCFKLSNKVVNFDKIRSAFIKC